MPNSIYLIPEKLDFRTATSWLMIGLCLVLLSGWMPLIPNYQTFIHMWRVELAASIFVAAVVGFTFFRLRRSGLKLSLSSQEINFIVLPVAAFVFWSGLSMIWAPSWKSALHHTTVWAVYLCFFIIVRQVIEAKNGYDNLIRSMALTFLIVMLPAIVEYISFLITGGGTVLGLRYAKYGEQINAISPLITVGVLHLRGKRFIAGLLFIVAMLLFTVATLGRMNLFLFVLAQATLLILVFAVKRFRHFRKNIVIVAAVLILTMVSVNIFSALVAPSNENTFSRFTSAERTTDSNNFRKLMTSLSLEMFRAKPIVGVGADNFGMAVNTYREIYGIDNPHDTNLRAAENDLPERTHNEFLQILAELGIVGISIFLSFLLGVGLMAIAAFRKCASLLSVGALVGVFMFLASSLVSSYSFRFVQNALVFFVVLAVASRGLLKPRKRRQLVVPALSLKVASVFAIFLCLSLAGYSIVRAASAYYASRGNHVKNTDEAMPLYQRAFWLDGENAYARYDLASRLLDDGRYSEAIPHYEIAAKQGLATSPNLSYFSTAQMLAGDRAGAAKTFAYAVKLYPRSVFVLTRHAFLLKQNGQPDDAASHLQRAKEIDAPAAETWWTMMNDGSEQATDNTEQNASLTPIMELTPHRSIYAIKKERDLRFPEEKFEFPK